MEVAVQELQMIIKWAKQLSSFNSLDSDDQISLLNEGIPSGWFILKFDSLFISGKKARIEKQITQQKISAKKTLEVMKGAA